MDSSWLSQLLQDHYTGILVTTVLAWGIWTRRGMRKVQAETLTAVKKENADSEMRIEALFQRKGYTLNAPRGFNPAKYERIALERSRDEVKDEIIREVRKEIERILAREVK